MWRNQARLNALRRVGNDELVSQLIEQVNLTRRRIKSILWLLTLGALAIALSHPVWGVSAEVVQVEGTAILFVIDVSRSMDAQDIAPSRLERANLISSALQKKSSAMILGLSYSQVNHLFTCL